MPLCHKVKVENVNSNNQQHIFNPVQLLRGFNINEHSKENRPQPTSIVVFFNTILLSLIVVPLVLNELKKTHSQYRIPKRKKKILTSEMWKQQLCTTEWKNVRIKQCQTNTHICIQSKHIVSCFGKSKTCVFYWKLKKLNTDASLRCYFIV